MTVNQDALDRQLWELVYGLLDEAEAESLTARVCCEPDVARAYAEVKLRVERLAMAAALPEPPIELRQDAEGRSASDRLVAPARSAARGSAETGPAASGAARLMNRLAGLAALALLGFVGYSYFNPPSAIRDAAGDSQRRALTDRHRRLVVAGPQAIVPGADARYSVWTTSIDGRPQATEVAYRLYDSKDELKLSHSEKSNVDGRLHFCLAAVDAGFRRAARSCPAGR